VTRQAQLVQVAHQGDFVCPVPDTQLPEYVQWFFVLIMVLLIRWIYRKPVPRQLSDLPVEFRPPHACHQSRRTPTRALPPGANQYGELE